MTSPEPRRLFESSMLRIAGVFTPVASAVYEPAQRLGTVVCVHDFAGTGLDFEPLAAVLVAEGYRVICPDMLGRGRSGYANDPATYAIPTYIQQLLALLTKYPDREVTLVGSGWGALISLLLIDLTSFRPKSLVLSDLAPNWSASTDPSLQLLRYFNGQHFETRESAVRELLNYGAMAGVKPTWRERLAEGRLREVEGGGFAYAADPRLVQNMRALGSREYDVTRLLKPVTMDVALLWGRALSGYDREAVTGALGKARSLRLTDGLNPLGRVWFSRPRQIRPVLAAMSGAEAAAAPASEAGEQP